MANQITEVVFVLDVSGSMSPLKEDTIGGFNEMIKKQKEADGKCIVSCVMFSNESRVFLDRVSLENVRDMTENDYTPMGCTALFDAVGGAVRHIRLVHGGLNKEEYPDKTMFVIMTDGMENASRKFGAGDVRKMIEAGKECGWEFLFIGANIDAALTAEKFGISRDRTANYNADKEGTKVVYGNLARTVMEFRTNACVSSNWSEDIDSDYLKRKK